MNTKAMYLIAVIFIGCSGLNAGCTWNETAPDSANETAPDSALRGGCQSICQENCTPWSGAYDWASLQSKCNTLCSNCCSQPNRACTCSA